MGGGPPFVPDSVGSHWADARLSSAADGISSPFAFAVVLADHFLGRSFGPELDRFRRWRLGRSQLARSIVRWCCGTAHRTAEWPNILGPVGPHPAEYPNRTWCHRHPFVDRGIGGHMAYQWRGSGHDHARSSTAIAEGVLIRELLGLCGCLVGHR